MDNIDTFNSNSITIIGDDDIIKLYFLKKSNEFFGYYICNSGLLPFRNKCINYISNYIFKVMNTSNVDVKIKYSVNTSKKKINIMNALISNPKLTFTFSNLLQTLKIIS